MKEKKIKPHTKPSRLTKNLIETGKGLKDIGLISKEQFEYFNKILSSNLVKLPWTYTIETENHEGSIYYIIRVNELPGICTDCENLEEGMQDIKDLIACAVEIDKENKNRG